MKVCPTCQKTYTDDNLNFCLDDGSVLSQASGADPLPETVLINQPRLTSPNQPPGSQPGAPGGWGSAPNSPNPQSYSMQPPVKSSKTWIWVVGILGLVVLVCGGGLVGFFAYVASQDSSTPSNDSTPVPSPTATPSGRSTAKPIDMSKWAENSTDADTEYTGGELLLASKQKGYYYVMVSKSNDYDKADVSVSVRNAEDGDTGLGYGLIFHSAPTPLIRGYGFLIDAKKKRYRVVQHSIRKETEIIKWTDYPKMKGGSEVNVLEARDDGNKVGLYINGDKVANIDNSYSGTNGVPGIYSGDAVKAAFSKLEIRK
jgi:hypothetical protein